MVLKHLRGSCFAVRIRSTQKAQTSSEADHYSHINPFVKEEINAQPWW